VTSLTPTRSELLDVFERLLGTWYPDDYVVAIIDELLGERAMHALGMAGFTTESVHLCDREEVRSIGKSISERWTTFHRTGEALAGALAEQDVVAGGYLAEAQSGASIITVLCSDLERVEDAGQVLGAQGARMVRHYGARNAHIA
jgi:hypothetical protein